MWDVATPTGQRGHILELGEAVSIRSRRLAAVVGEVIPRRAKLRASAIQPSRCGARLRTGLRTLLRGVVGDKCVAVQEALTIAGVESDCFRADVPVVITADAFLASKRN